jgi:5-methyltetrahydropteroyltriglutamate--homocysteine methyltransferase
MSETIGGDKPLRVDQVGSLLRPASLLAARAQAAQGALAPDALRAIEDDAIRDVIIMQQALGLPVVTDGEFRRGLYSDNFTISALTGVEMDQATGSWAFHGDKPASAPRMVVNGRIGWSGLSRNAADFAFVKQHASTATKITLPGPAFIHYRAGRADISRDIYPDLELFWSDLAAAYAQELAALHQAGCRYVQLDETSLAKFGDPAIQQKLAERGDDWRDLLERYTEILNAVADAAPPGMMLAIHLCRGNNQGRWQAEGGYQLVAETLFRKLRISRYLLEFDTPRAGSLDILRALPDGKIVVLGLVSTKTGSMETMAGLRARIAEASRYTALDQLAISPQCGFASVEHGNPITQTQQNEKLRLCVETAAEIWN